jgi:hypothetical protein
MEDPVPPTISVVDKVVAVLLEVEPLSPGANDLVVGIVAEEDDTVEIVREMLVEEARKSAFKLEA